MSFEATEQMKAAYQWARLPPDYSLTTDLADLAQHATAAAMEAEFWASVAIGSTDPRVSYTGTDWLRLADEKLKK